MASEVRWGLWVVDLTIIKCIDGQSCDNKEKREKELKGRTLFSFFFFLFNFLASCAATNRI